MGHSIMFSFIFAEVHTHEEVINVTMYCNLTYLLRRVEDIHIILQVNQLN